MAKAIQSVCTGRWVSISHEIKLHNSNAVHRKWCMQVLDMKKETVTGDGLIQVMSSKDMQTDCQYFCHIGPDKPAQQVKDKTTNKLVISD